MLIGPSTLLPGAANIPVPTGGCAFSANWLFPSLDRTGWQLQRTENGKTIDMFPQKRDLNGYDGKMGDFPYLEYIDGVAYPNIDQQDWWQEYWLCGSTQGSCTMAPSFGGY